MRESINSNPVVQAALVGVLIIACMFLLFTRVFAGGSSGDAAPSEPATTPAATTEPPSPAAGTAGTADVPAPALAASGGAAALLGVAVLVLGALALRERGGGRGAGRA